MRGSTGVARADAGHAVAAGGAVQPRAAACAGGALVAHPGVGGGDGEEEEEGDGERAEAGGGHGVAAVGGGSRAGTGARQESSSVGVVGNGVMGRS